MKSLIQTYKKTGNLHHAYLMLGERGAVRDVLYSFFKEELGVLISGNPDFWYAEYDAFGIDEGRALKDMQLKKAVLGGRKIFVIAADSITREAQNSLLKIFEEPTEGTLFFLIMPSRERILPTLISRVTLGIVDSMPDQEINSLAQNFLLGDFSGRLATAKKIVDDISEGKKTKKFAVDFLDSIEKNIREAAGSRLLTEKEISALRELLKCRGYIRDTSSSVKILLDHVALTLPEPRS